MLCYAYGVPHMDDNSGKALFNLYCGMDEKEAIKIADKNKDKYYYTIVRIYGNHIDDGVLYHSKEKTQNIDINHK